MNPRMVPVVEAALAAHVSRERCVRMVQQGLVRGQLREGRYFVDARDLPRLKTGRALGRDRGDALAAGSQVV